jgi:hypothetical protein
MNKFLSLLACGAFLFFGAVPAEAQEWREYRPAGSGFRVELPGSPKIADTTPGAAANVSKYIIATVEPSATVAYLAIYSVFKPGTLNSDPQKSLDGAVSGLAKEGTVRSQKRFMYGTAPARHVIVDLANNQVGVDLMTMSGNTLIQIICVVPKGQETSPVIDRINKSFALVAQ